MDAITIINDISDQIKNNDNRVEHGFLFRIRTLYFYVENKDGYGNNFFTDYSISVCLDNTELSYRPCNAMKNKYFFAFEEFLKYKNVPFVSLDFPSHTRNPFPVISIYNIKWHGNDNNKDRYFLTDHGDGRRWANENGFKVWMKDRMSS